MHDLPRQKLRELILEYGRSLCDDPRRCEALLKDYCGEHKREIFVLMSALKNRVSDDLLRTQSAGLPKTMECSRARQRLEEELSMTTEAAQWAVESWALALGVIVKPSPVAKPAPVSPSPPTAAPKAQPTPSTSPSGRSDTLLGGRYRDHGDGTVTDVKTGLQWMRFSLGQIWKDGTCVGSANTYIWEAALNTPENLNKQDGYAGFNDWRLPTKNELLTLIYCPKKRLRLWEKLWKFELNECQDNGRNSTIFTSAFPNTPSLFWSSSVEADGNPWSVIFEDGFSAQFPPKADCAVRLVRDPSSALTTSSQSSHNIKPAPSNPSSINLRPAPTHNSSSKITPPDQSSNLQSPRNIKSITQGSTPINMHAISTRNSPSAITSPSQSPNSTASRKIESTLQNLHQINRNNISQPSSRSPEKLINKRYSIYENGTVLDISTGLQWMRFSLGQDWIKGSISGEAKKYNWEGARNAASDFNFKGGHAGYTDWHIPTKEELLTLVYCESKQNLEWNENGKGCSFGCKKPTICNTAFPHTAMYYWSSSMHESFPGFAWVVFFDTGRASVSRYDADGAVRLVRKTHV
jgi:hypothetical protein